MPAGRAAYLRFEHLNTAPAPTDVIDHPLAPRGGERMIIEIPVFPATDFRLTLLSLDDDGRVRLGSLGPLLGLDASGRRWAQLNGLWLCGGAPGVAVLSPQEIDALPHYARLRIDRGGRLHLGRLVRVLSLSHGLAALVDDRVAQLFLINADRAAAGLMGLIAMTARDAVSGGTVATDGWTGAGFG